jgi:N-carbamoyl-L-amino-acid hydrolase
LDETGEMIGIVRNIAAPTRFKITVEGLADHSGATPMSSARTLCYRCQTDIGYTGGRG